MTQGDKKGEADGNRGVPYFSGQSLNWLSRLVSLIL